MVSSAGSTTTAHRPLLVLALVAVLAALAFPFAPVHQPEVRFDWTAADGATAFPLMPYQPIELRAATSCATARAAGSRVLLSTVPLRPDPAADPLYGLRLTVVGDRLRLASAGAELGEVALPATVVVDRDIAGWTYPGRARVPELDPIG